MKTDGRALRLKCLDLPTHGILKVKFDLGSFNHPIYGTCSNLCGEYELFHTRSSYPISNYFTLSKEEQGIIMKKAMKRHRQLFENLDEEDFFKQILHAVGATALCCPRLDANSDAYEISVDQMALSCCVDDAGEEELLNKSIPEYYHLAKPELLKFQENSKRIYHAVDNEKPWNDFKAKALKAYPESEQAILTTERITEKVNKLYDGKTPKTTKYTAESGIRSVEAGLLGYRGEGPLAFTERQLERIRSCEAGMELYMEFSSFLQKFAVPKYIRKTLLFGLLVEGVRDFGSYTNDLIGLMKDVDQEETNKNVILRRVVREGISLEKSFGMILKALKDTIHDMNVTIQLLLESFPGEEALVGYINAAKDLCDGQTIGYVLSAEHKGRYGVFPITIEPTAELIKNEE